MATITLPAEMSSLYPALDFIKGAAGGLGFDEKKMFHLTVASEEVVANVINYAYAGAKGDFQVTCTLKDGRGLEVEVVDWGRPFDPLSMPDPDLTLPLTERKIGGLGIFLVRKMMNEVRYRRDGDRNILTFVKY